jgi:DNA-3-methyladenine glycosylase
MSPNDVMNKLPRSFYQQNTIEVAKQLLGKYLVHHHQNTEYIGKIVEVEAYLGSHDLACHSSKGRTKRTEVMFGPAGYTYVYLIYGMYYCTNVVTEDEGIGSAVLLRAIEPIQHITSRTQGPGLLSKAMHIDKQLNQHDLLSNDFYIAESSQNQPLSIIEKPRIGVHYAKEWADKLLRFYIKDNAFISRA